MLMPVEQILRLVFILIIHHPVKARMPPSGATRPREIKKLFDPSSQNDTQAFCILFRPTPETLPDISTIVECLRKFGWNPNSEVKDSVTIDESVHRQSPQTV